LKYSSCVVTGLHKGVDQSVDFRLLACDRKVLRRLELDLVLALRGLVTLVPHQHSCWVNYL
jgi:hypothetical protein